jgi:hypothetical protein
VSKRRKEEKKKRKRSVLVQLGVVCCVVLVVVGVLAYQKFVRGVKPEDFIPENPVAFLLIDINPDSEQNVALEKLAVNLGNENIFREYIESQFFQGISKDNLKINEEDLKSWLGEKLVISRIELSSQEDRSAHVVEVKNVEKAKEVLSVINENIKRRGSVVGFEDFRDVNIVFIEGQEDIAYAFYDDFLLVSEDPAGIKTMIDTISGKNRSLSSDRIYNRLKRKLKGEKHVVFAFFDLVKSLRYVSKFGSQLDVSFIDKIASEARMNLGAVFTARENGVEVNVLLGGNGESYGQKKKGFEPGLASKVPAGIVAYVEGQEFKSFVERLFAGQGEDLSEEDVKAKAEIVKRGINLQFGLDLDEDVFDMFGGRYGFVLFPFKEGKGFSAGIILDRDESVDAEEKLKKIEEIVLGEINNKLIRNEEEKVTFFDREYKGQKYRLAKLPDSIRLDIYYTVLPTKVIVATTKTALTSLIDSVSFKASETLVQNSRFKKTYKEIKSKDTARLIFVDIDNLFELLDKFEYLKYSTLKDEFRRMESLGFLSRYSSEGGWADGFLLVREED